MTATAASRLVGFGVALAVLFGIGALLGGVVDPAPPKAAKAEPAAAMEGGHGGEEGDMPMQVRGLGVEQDGLRLVVDTPKFERGQARELRYRVVDKDGSVVRDYDVEHTKRMHLIVVRRDLTGFQHLHPKQDADGAWVTPLRLDEPGSYRVFADFSHDETPTTLASDLMVDGDYRAQQLPAPADTVETDGFEVTRDDLTFRVTRDGRPVEVQPYLGANGHLVALRENDLAFLHVHPEGGLEFEATFPTAGKYRLFLQFKVDGKVHTAAFTEEVK